jgi:leucyl/phenylalanyl-tRNA---protein transferase
VPEAPRNRKSDPRIIPPEILMQAYAQGIFPMADSRNDPEINWYSARRRGIIPFNAFRVPRKVHRLIRKQPYRWSVNEDFRGVIEGCADRETTWISDRIVASFEELHKAGHAHSVEIWQGSRLVAGTYGASLRSAFFAESMFQRVPEMSKVALFHCHQVLVDGGFQLWDVQFYTRHLAQFGCREIDARIYRRLLARALRHKASFAGREGTL